MAIIDKIEYTSKKAIGCILTHKNKYLIFHRVKDNTWASISGGIENNETPEQAVQRELFEEIKLKIKPEKLATTYHKYGNETVEYTIFYYDFEKIPELFLKRDELKDFKLLSLSDALKLKLYPDEDYVLKLHNKLIPK